jgi:Cu(I)/Ag(I) efflux system membrane protein CusA/SilA
MIGDMVSSPILTLIVIPAVYALVKGIGLERAKELAPVAAE